MPRQSERLSLNRRVKPENRRRKRRRETDRRQFLEAELGAAGKRQRVDLLLGNEEHDLMAARPQDFRDRETRETDARRFRHMR